MSTIEKLKIEAKKKKSPLTAWAFWLLASAFAVVLIAWGILRKNPPHALAIGGSFLLLMAVIYTGLGVSFSNRKDKADILKLENIKTKLKDKKHNKDILYNQLDDLLGVLIDNATDRKDAAINQIVAFGLSFCTAAVGTVFVVLDLIYV